MARTIVSEGRTNSSRTRAPVMGRAEDTIWKNSPEYKRQKAEQERIQREVENISKEKFSNISNVTEYEDQYRTLSESQKTYFPTPTQFAQQLEDKRQAQIKETKTLFDKRVEQINAEIKKYENRMQEVRNQYHSTPSKREGDRERFDSKMYDLEKEIEGLRTEIGGLQRGMRGFAEKGASFSQIQQYADSYKEYRISRRQAKKEARQKMENLKWNFTKNNLILEQYKSIMSNLLKYDTQIVKENPFVKPDIIESKDEDKYNTGFGMLGEALYDLNRRTGFGTGIDKINKFGTQLDKPIEDYKLETAEKGIEGGITYLRFRRDQELENINKTAGILDKIITKLSPFAKTYINKEIETATQNIERKRFGYNLIKDRISNSPFYSGTKNLIKNNIQEDLENNAKKLYILKKGIEISKPYIKDASEFIKDEYKSEVENKAVQIEKNLQRAEDIYNKTKVLEDLKLETASRTNQQDLSSLKSLEESGERNPLMRAYLISNIYKRGGKEAEKVLKDYGKDQVTHALGLVKRYTVDLAPDTVEYLTTPTHTISDGMIVSGEKEYTPEEWEKKLAKDKLKREKAIGEGIYGDIGSEEFNFQDVREKSELLQELFPSDPADMVRNAQNAALFVVGYEALPATGKAIVDGYIAYEGVKQMTDKEKSAADRAIYGVIALGSAASAGARSKEIIRGGGPDFIKRIKSKDYDAEEVFAESVLKGDEKYLTTKDKDAGLSKFKESKEGEDLIGMSAMDFTPGRKGKIESSNKVSLEDKGIWMTPEGSTNIAYLKLNPENREVIYTFNPLKSSQGKNPNILRIKYKDVKEIPQDVQKEFRRLLREKGEKEAYEYGNKFFQSEAEKGVAYIPFKTVSGNKELQALIPDGNYYFQDTKTFAGKIKGFEKHTTLDGKVIPIRDVKIVYSTKSESLASKKNLRLIDKKIIRKYQKDNELYFRNANKEYRTPYQQKVDFSRIRRGEMDRREFIPYRGTRSDRRFSDRRSFRRPETYPYEERYPSRGDYRYTDYPVTERYYPSPQYPQKRTGDTRKGLIIPKKTRYKKGTQVYLISPGGKQIPRDIYGTKYEAQIEGKFETDETAFNKFTTKSVRVPENQILKSTRKDSRSFKFTREGNLWKEKKKYRKDRKNENSNWMSLMGTVKTGY